MSERKCPRCGVLLPPDAPEGLCPGCLLGAGLSETRHIEEPPRPSGEIDEEMLPENMQADFPELEILGVVGRGGMGIVYKARQIALDRLVALKVLLPKFEDQAAFSERFVREARTLAHLHHPNIVVLYDFGQAGGHWFFVMEYVDGVDLRHALREGRLPPERALEIVPSICDALQYAHSEGVVHRDIKPENVLIDRKGQVHIADFGLAKILLEEDEGHGLTGTRDMMGTPQYMAPEQFSSPATVDHRADIYALGVVFYEMLTGDLPIGRFAPPSHKVHVDVRLDEIVLRSLEHEPEMRYQKASEVKVAVESVADTGAKATESSRSSTRWRRRRRTSPDSRAKRRRKPLRKSRAHARLGGVCAGIADHLGVDPWIIRVVYLMLLLIPYVRTGALVGYAILCVVLMWDSPGETEETAIRFPWPVVCTIVSFGVFNRLLWLWFLNWASSMDAVFKHAGAVGLMHQVFVLPSGLYGQLQLLLVTGLFYMLLPQRRGIRRNFVRLLFYAYTLVTLVSLWLVIGAIR